MAELGAVPDLPTGQPEFAAIKSITWVRGSCPPGKKIAWIA